MRLSKECMARLNSLTEHILESPYDMQARASCNSGVVALTTSCIVSDGVRHDVSHATRQPDGGMQHATWHEARGTLSSTVEPSRTMPHGIVLSPRVGRRMRSCAAYTRRCR